MDLQLVGSILELIRLEDHVPAELPRLVEGYESRVQVDGYCRAWNEASRFDRRHQVRSFGRPCLGHQLDHLREDVLVRENRGDVAKDDSLLRVVGDIADELLWLLGRRHRTDRKYSSVRRSPSSRPTSGCHSSMVRARVISG